MNLNFMNKDGDFLGFVLNIKIFLYQNGFLRVLVVEQIMTQLLFENAAM